MAYQKAQPVVNTEFDLRTHLRDEKSGVVVRKNPYRLYYREGIQYFERPVGSGNLWFKSGEPAGRMIDNKIQEVEHVAYNPPPTADEKLAMDLIVKDGKIAQLERELEAIRKEKRAAPAPKKAE